MAYSVWVYDWSSVSDVDTGEDERLSCTSCDFEFAFWGKVVRFEEGVGEEHACVFEPAYKVDIVDVLELVVVSPYHALLPHACPLVSGIFQRLDSRLDLVERKDLGRRCTLVFRTSYAGGREGSLAGHRSSRDRQGRHAKSRARQPNPSPNSRHPVGSPS